MIQPDIIKENYDVTILVNSYKENEFNFRRSIESILANKNTINQIILSTVKNDDCIEWSKDYDLFLIINDNAGIFHQLNNTLTHIKGKYVTYQSSNDFMYDYKLELETNLLVNHNKLVCYSSYDIVDINNNESVTNFTDYDYNLHKKQNFVSDCSMVNAEIFLKYTPFEIKYGNSAYHHLWLNIYENCGDVFYNNKIPTWKYIVTKDSSHYKKQFNKKMKEGDEYVKNLMLKENNRI